MSFAIANRMPASHREGYAARPGESAYPDLWNGCLIAMLPALGPASMREPGLIVPSVNLALANDLNWGYRNLGRGHLGAGYWSGSGWSGSDGTSNPYFTVQAPGSANNPLSPLPVPCTLFWSGMWSTPNDSNIVALLGNSTRRSAGKLNFYRSGYQFYIATGSSRVEVYEHDGAGGTPGSFQSNDNAVPADTVHSVLIRVHEQPFTASPNPAGDVWVDGVDVTSLTAVAGPTVDEGNQSRILGHTEISGNPGATAWTTAWAFWERALDEAEIHLLSADPLALARLPLLHPMQVEEALVSLGDIRSRRWPPEPRRKRTPQAPTVRPPDPIPIVIPPAPKSRKPEFRRRKTARRREVIVARNAGSVVASQQVGLIKRIMEMRSSFNVIATGGAEYRFYRSTSLPLTGSDIFHTSADLHPFQTPTDTFGDGTWYLGVSYFNGIEDSGFLPVGPAGEPYLVLIIASGTEQPTPPIAPSRLKLQQLAGGVVRVHATYTEQGANRAEEWALAYTTNGSTPAVDTPDVTVAMGTSQLEILQYDLPAQSHGTTVKVRVQTRRDDGGQVYSLDSQVLEITADAEAPAVPPAGGSYPGGVPLNE
jgi:hypothetical protein